MIDFRGQHRINRVHARFDRVAALVKAYRIAAMIGDSTYMEDDCYLETDDHEALSGEEREHVLLCIEQELRHARRELQRVVPQQDILDLLEQWDRYLAAFTKEFGTPNSARAEEGQP